MTLTVRRASAALALGVALATAGCGSIEANRAATVDGRVITEAEVHTAQSEINEAYPQANLVASDVLTRLIRAPYILDVAAEQGAPLSVSVAEAAFPGKDPSSVTIELLRAELAAQNLQQSGVEIPLETFSALQIDVNPRYGEFDPQTASVAATLPEWVTPFSADQ